MESPTLRSDEGLSTTWSDQPGCLPRVNLQLPHKDHFNYTVQTSLKSPIFPFVYLRECHINWLITVFLSHFQKTHGGKRGEGEKGKLSMPHSWKQQKKTKTDMEAWGELAVPWGGMMEKGFSAAGAGVLLQDGRSGSGWVVGWPALATELRVHRERDGGTETLPWHSSTALTTTLLLPPAHGLGWAHPGFCALLRQMRGSSFSGGWSHLHASYAALYRNKLDSLISWR